MIKIVNTLYSILDEVRNPKKHILYSHSFRIYLFYFPLTTKFNYGKKMLKNIRRWVKPAQQTSEKVLKPSFKIK